MSGNARLAIILENKMYLLTITGKQKEKIVISHTDPSEVFKQFDRMRNSGQLEGYTHWSRLSLAEPVVIVPDTYKRPSENLRN